MSENQKYFWKHDGSLIQNPSKTYFNRNKSTVFIIIVVLKNETINKSISGIRKTENNKSVSCEPYKWVIILGLHQQLKCEEQNKWNINHQSDEVSAHLWHFIVGFTRSGIRNELLLIESTSVTSKRITDSNICLLIALTSVLWSPQNRLN